MFRRALGVWACVCVAAGCAPALPVLDGALPTPRDRGDVLLGGAVRLPLGDELPEEPAAPGGVAPVASVRYGLGPHTDLGVMAVGSLGRLDVRHAIVLGDDGTTRVALTGAIAPYVGKVHEGGLRLGGTVPLLFSIEVGGLAELWLGPRVGLERASSNAEGSTTGLSAGGVAGIGVGFRHFHALTEISVTHERRWGETDRAGLVLTPAFGLRLRL